MRVNSFAFLADDELIEALVAGSNLVPCIEDCVLFNQGDEAVGVYVIQGGEIALVMKSELGGVVMCIQVGPGSLIGLPGAIADQPYSLTALARRGSVIRFTTSNELRELLVANPALYPSMLKVLATEVREARRAILDSAGSGAICRHQ